ncbi:MAG: WxcM-like domain-containing protein [Dehalococcoidia bacterium]
MRIEVPYDRREDDRGTLIHVTNGQWRQVNVVYSKKGVLRGGHYHTSKEEFFFVVRGKVEVKVVDIREGPEAPLATHLFSTGEAFAMEPWEQHYMRFHEDTVLLVLYDQPFNPNDLDSPVDPRFAPLDQAFGAPDQAEDGTGSR